MNVGKMIEGLAGDPVKLAVAALLVVGGVYFFTRQAVKDVAGVGAAAAETVAGVVTGNNAITQSAKNADGVPVSAYEGAGVLGTLGAATNAASGGWLATGGEKLGGWVYNLLHSDD